MRGTAPITRQDKSQWKCVSGDPRSLKRKAAGALLQLLARATFYTCSESPTQRKLGGEKKILAWCKQHCGHWQDALLQQVQYCSRADDRWQRMVFFSFFFLIIFQEMKGCIWRQIVLTHYKYNRWTVSWGNLNSVVILHFISFDLKKCTMFHFWIIQQWGLSEGKVVFIHDIWKIRHVWHQNGEIKS